MATKQPRKPKEKKPSLLALSQGVEDPSTAGPDRELCKLCGLDRETSNPYLNPPVNSRWTGKILAVGEGAGAEEEKSGRFFVGRAGKMLDEMLAKAGWTRDDVELWNAVRCRPKNNHTPSMRQVRCCRPFLNHRIQTLKPKVVVAMGATAAKAISNDGSASVVKMRGRPEEV